MVLLHTSNKITLSSRIAMRIISVTSAHVIDTRSLKFCLVGVGA